jgi:4-carboxymuconolactone decarboxylase
MRIEGLPKNRAGLLGRFFYWMSKRSLGKVADPLTVMAHHGWVLFGYGIFELASLRARLLEPRLKELAQIKAATLVGCPF